jgi:sec-independent protein translocase protein TatA
LIVVALLLLFGASRLPQLAKSLGQSKRAFREGLDEAEEEARLGATRKRERLRAAEADTLDDADKLTAAELKEGKR